MSDLNDLIARNAVMAFRIGYQSGKTDELARVVEIIEKRKNYDCTCKCKCHAHTAPCHACVVDGELIEIIKGETNA